MDRLAGVTGRPYHLFDYVGAPDAERVIAIMGSGAEAVEETVEDLRRQGEKVGLLKVRLYRPFSVEHFIKSLPPTVRTLIVLDRTKEPGSIGEPLYLDVVAALHEAARAPRPRVIGGRFGLSSKEFTPAMVKAVFDNAKQPVPRNHFTIGIRDDVTHTSLDYDEGYSLESPDVVRAVFYGLGSDGTVGANKNSIKIIGEETDLNVQGYFVYDSKKSGSVTVSHLRFGPRPIRSSYLIRRATFVACHQWSFLDRMDVLGVAEPGGVFLLNSPYGPEEVWDKLPRPVQETILGKKLRLFVIDAFRVAHAVGMGGRINTVMQTCFFALAGCCRATRPLPPSRSPSSRPTASAARPSWISNNAAVDAHAGPPPRGPGSGQRDLDHRHAAGRAGQRPGIREEGHRADDPGRRRSDTGQRRACGRHLADRHDALGEAKHRPGGARLG